MDKSIYNILFLSLIQILFSCTSTQKKIVDKKNGVKIGVSKYSPYSVGAKRIYDQAVLIPEEWAHLRPFFTEKKNDAERFARTKNSNEEILYKVDKNIQGFCVYATYKPDVKHNFYSALNFYVSENGTDWKPVAKTLEEKKRMLYKITQPSGPWWVNVQYFGFRDFGGNYLKIQWNSENGNIDSPQINRVEINYSDSQLDGWKNMFIDECSDFSKTYSHSANIQIDSGDPSNHRSVIVYADKDDLQQEIKYAVESGIDFWIWLMTEKTSAHTWSIEQYLSLPNKSDVGFCVELHLSNELPESGESSLNETWDEYCQRLVRYFSEPNYVKVLDGRPLVYTICNVTDADVKKLREIAISAGFKNPYLVNAYWGKPGTKSADARSEYNGSNGFNADVWDYYANYDKLKIMPNFATGMNDICRKDNPPPWGRWTVDKPFLTAEEIKQGLREAIDYVAENPESCEAQVLTVFDWDSQTEAGWLCPELAKDGTITKKRLNTFKEVLLSGEDVNYERKRIKRGSNFVFNSGFEVNTIPRHRPIGWQTSLSQTDDLNMYYAFQSQRSGYYSDLCGIFSYGKDYKITAFQNIPDIPDGIFTLSAYVKSNGRQKIAQMFIMDYGGEELICPIKANDQWTKISISNIRITSGNCVVGFYSDSPANEWLMFDNISLEKK